MFFEERNEMSDDCQLRLSVSGLVAKIGSEIAVSKWVTIDQSMIDSFATISGDFQFIHVDPARARRESQFGGTIVHGMLVLSLLPALAHQSLPAIDGRKININYGFDRVRFTTPVPVGSDVRARIMLKDVTRKSRQNLMIRYGVAVEIRGIENPAAVIDWLTLMILETPVEA
ncbi:MaoC family dehydratase [Caballeronia sp. SEWSISQ10-4 2]|uniref:MaoC family dehydratase n=1 Tax=Caballeronia sp. SEWSISQ10-4 2 TaxID=2937438 RepID=UPI0026510557|nr:MaoC family dehydratase [Caballeronia sp. SEWSISQ10-4 2]MDN7179242.1 MaoC family dehydratase [Caballeronia sp. SEWSISQ10-4 2]